MSTIIMDVSGVTICARPVAPQEDPQAAQGAQRTLRQRSRTNAASAPPSSCSEPPELRVVLVDLSVLSLRHAVNLLHIAIEIGTGPGLAG